MPHELHIALPPDTGVLGVLLGVCFDATLEMLLELLWERGDGGKANLLGDCGVTDSAGVDICLETGVEVVAGFRDEPELVIVVAGVGEIGAVDVVDVDDVVDVVDFVDVVEVNDAVAVVAVAVDVDVVDVVDIVVEVVVVVEKMERRGTSGSGFLAGRLTE